MENHGDAPNRVPCKKCSSTVKLGCCTSKYLYFYLQALPVQMGPNDAPLHYLKYVLKTESNSAKLFTTFVMYVLNC